MSEARIGEILEKVNEILERVKKLEYYHQYRHDTDWKRTQDVLHFLMEKHPKEFYKMMEGMKKKAGGRT